MKELCAITVRDLFDYDSRSGNLYWRRPTSNVVKPGDIAGCPHKSGYGRVKVNGREYAAHRVAWLHFYGRWPEQELDHINGIKMDNRILNLREVSRSCNMQNLKAANARNKSSGLLGVSYQKKSRKYRAAIWKDGKMIHLGLYETAEDAHQVYLEAKRRIHEGCTI